MDETKKENLINGYSMALNEWALDKRIKTDLGLLIIISSLCAERGYCFASNSYFADLFDLDEVTISRKLKNLESAGHITIEYIRRGAEVIQRNIRLTKMLTDDLQKRQSTINKNVKEKNISNKNNNNNNNIVDEYEKEIGLLTPYQYERLITYTVDLSQEMIIEAIHIASRMNKKNLAYVEAILKNWIQNGYKVIGDIKNKKPIKEIKKFESNISSDDLAGLYDN